MLQSDIGNIGFKYIDTAEAFDRFLLIHTELDENIIKHCEDWQCAMLLGKLTEVALQMTDRDKDENFFIPRQSLLGQCKLNTILHLPEIDKKHHLYQTKDKCQCSSDVSKCHVMDLLTSLPQEKNIKDLKCNDCNK